MDDSKYQHDSRHFISLCASPLAHDKGQRYHSGQRRRSDGDRSPQGNAKTDGCGLDKGRREHNTVEKVDGNRSRYESSSNKESQRDLSGTACDRHTTGTWTEDVLKRLQFLEEAQHYRFLTETMVGVSVSRC